MQRVFLSGRVFFDEDVLYVKQDGSIYAYGYIQNDDLRLRVSVRSSYYEFMTSGGHEVFLVEGFVFPQIDESEGETMILLARRVLPLEKNGNGRADINQIIFSGHITEARETRRGYLFEVEVASTGVPVFLSLFCDTGKLRYPAGEGDEIVVAGRLKEVKDTGALVVFADEIEVVVKNYEFRLRDRDHEAEYSVVIEGEE